MTSSKNEINTWYSEKKTIQGHPEGIPQVLQCPSHEGAVSFCLKHKNEAERKRERFKN